jgi:hypothetical protein
VCLQQMCLYSVVKGSCRVCMCTYVCVWGLHNSLFCLQNPTPYRLVFGLLVWLGVGAADDEFLGCAALRISGLVALGVRRVLLCVLLLVSVALESACRRNCSPSVFS